MPVTFGLYSASTQRDVDALGGEVRVERGRVDGAVRRRRAPRSSAPSKSCTQVSHGSLSVGSRAGVQVDVDQRVAVEHQRRDPSGSMREPTSTSRPCARSSTRRILPVAVVG